MPADRVLGVDPGLSVCGYGVVEQGDGGPRAVAAGVIRTSADRPPSERLGALLGELERLVSEVRPTWVAVERVFFQANVRTAMAVGQASGLVLAAAGQAGVPVAEYTPNEVKQAVAGYGAAGKRQMQAMVTRLLGLAEAPEPADAADALALALCHLSSARLRGRVRVPGGRAPGLERAIQAALEREGGRP